MLGLISYLDTAEKLKQGHLSLRSQSRNEGYIFSTITMNLSSRVCHHYHCKYYNQEGGAWRRSVALIGQRTQN